MTVSTPTPTVAEIAERRRELEARRDTLIARRPSVALAAAGGDPAALETARAITGELADLVVELDGLDLAQREVARLDEAGRRQRAAERRRELTNVLGDARATLAAELVATEARLATLAEQLARLAAAAQSVDQAAGRVEQRSAAVVATRLRLAGRLAAITGVNWPLLLVRGALDDHTPLSPADVP